MTHINDSCSFGPGTTFAPFTDLLRGYEPEMPNTCIILQYSRIATLVHDPLQLSVQPYHFEQQMEYLAENCNVLSAEGLAYRLTQGKPFPRRSVVLMFDGGYADLLYTAQDVLRRLSLPAMAFVPTAHLLERRPRWYDELEDLLIGHRVTGQCELIVDHDVLRLSLHSSRDRFAAYSGRGSSCAKATDWGYLGVQTQNRFSELCPEEDRGISPHVGEGPPRVRKLSCRNKTTPGDRPAKSLSDPRSLSGKL